MKSIYATTIYIISLIIISSCSTHSKIEYVDREVVRYETREIHDTLIRDTHDSIYHSILQVGDTIYNTKYVEHTIYKDKIVYVRDTIRNDSIIIKVKENTIEKKVVPKWCWYCLVFCIIFAIFVGIKVYRWIR